MKDYITKYLYNDSYIRKYLSDTQYRGIDKEAPSFFRADDVTILPTKKDPDLFWGRGGAITNEGEFIEASRVGDAFGGYYDFEKEKVPFYRETVIYIPVIPNHWGHFLLDCLCRFWFINDDKYKDYRIAFCGYNWSNNQVEGNYLELLHLMGIDDSRLIYIKEPCSFACVLIPEPTLGYTIANSSYRNIIDTIISNVVLDTGIMIFAGNYIGIHYIPNEYQDLWGMVMKILANIVVIVLNYILSKLVVFKK